MIDLDNAVGIKLNLGARDQKIPGYLSMDWDKHPGVDVVGDISDLSMLRDGSVESIVASHCLEHFPLVRTTAVLREWHRVLKKDGTLYVAVPSMDVLVDIYVKYGFNEWLSHVFWGDQGDRSSFHYNGFNFARLEGKMKEAGFEDVSELEQFPFKMPHCCNLRYQMDNRLITLFVVAVK